MDILFAPSGKLYQALWRRRRWPWTIRVVDMICFGDGAGAGETGEQGAGVDAAVVPFHGEEEGDGVEVGVDVEGDTVVEICFLAGRRFAELLLNTAVKLFAFNAQDMRR